MTPAVALPEINTAVVRGAVADAETTGEAFSRTTVVSPAVTATDALAAPLRRIVVFSAPLAIALGAA